MPFFSSKRQEAFHEPSETSPLRLSRMKVEDFSELNRPQRVDPDQGEGISYATWAARTWTQWDKVTRALILAIGATIIIAAVVLLTSVAFSKPDPEQAGSSPNVEKTLLKQSSNVNEAVLEIPQGKLKWNILTSREGRNYYAFYKVPYAKPPIGELRFEPPQSPEKWERTRVETEVAPQCLQKSKYSKIIEAVGEEDCLYANIYTPKLPGIELQPNELLPVLFYIHGGGFTDGNGSRYGGKYFMDEDAVLITFQYRLGIFGFLSSEDGTVQGNMAMKDQIQALKWVKDNAQHFGGDPNCVMIYGNSAGAMSVNQLMISPMANGLFHRAITQSGPSFSAIVSPKEEQLTSFELLAKEVGCWSRIGNEKRRNARVLQCLRNQNASDLAVIRGEGIVFRTTVESYESADETGKFLPDTMSNMYKSGRVNNKIPWMIGVLSAEWIHSAAITLQDAEYVDNLNTNWTGYANSLYMIPYEESPVKDRISEESRDFYFGEKEVGNETMWNLTNIMSDRDIVYPSKLQGSWMSELGSDVFFYYMSKRPAKSYSDKALVGYPPGDYGASHADELQYLFNYYGYPEYPVGSKYFNFSRKLISIWVQFAKTGNPGWNAINTKETPLLWYELNDHMGPTTLLQERMQFWDQFTPDELCYI